MVEYLWAVHSPGGIHQAPQANCRDAQIFGYPTGNIHGRRATDGKLRTAVNRACSFLLENLGFIINSKKSLLSPTQDMEFLVSNCPHRHWKIFSGGSSTSPHATKGV